MNLYVRVDLPPYKIVQWEILKCEKHMMQEVQEVRHQRVVKSDYQIFQNKTKHPIIVTTFGDWSGLHGYSENNPEKVLIYLVDELNKAGYGNTDDSKIIIAAHQYCDETYI